MPCTDLSIPGAGGAFFMPFYQPTRGLACLNCSRQFSRSCFCCPLLFDSKPFNGPGAKGIQLLVQTVGINQRMSLAGLACFKKFFSFG